MSSQASNQSLTISFDIIKERARQIARESLEKSRSHFDVYVKGATGGGHYDFKAAAHTLLPALAEAAEAGQPIGHVHKEILDELIQKCEAVIERWDVRQVNRLVDLFPSAVPAACRLRNASCAYGNNSDDGDRGDNGDWAVTFDLTSRRQRNVASGAEEVALNFLAGSGGRLACLLPTVQRADEEYRTAWEKMEASLGKRGGQDANEQLFAATANFNKVLERAAFAFYLDTRAYNSWDTIQQVWGAKRHGSDEMTLWFVSSHGASSVVEMLSKMAADLHSGAFEDAIKEQAKGLPGVKQGAASDERERPRG